MCMLFLFMIYYKCIFIRFHEDKYSMAELQSEVLVCKIKFLEADFG